MNDQPKPASEWTDRQLSDIYSHGGLRGVADAHNAAIAAERDEVYKALSIEKGKVIAEVIQLREQLAAATARELHSYDVAKQCRDELDAAREKRDYWEQAYKQLFDAATTGIL